MKLLLPILSTECVAAIDPISKLKSSGIFALRHKDKIDNIASPAPTLSTTLLENAGQFIDLYLLLKSKAPLIPLVTTSVLILISLRSFKHK